MTLCIAAGRTETGDEVAGILGGVAVGKQDGGHGGGGETDGAPAFAAMEMHMPVTAAVTASGGADLVFGRAGAILYQMHKPGGCEERQRARDGGTVHSVKLRLYLERRQGTFRLRQHLCHKQAHGSGTYSTVKKTFFGIFHISGFIHIAANLTF